VAMIPGGADLVRERRSQLREAGALAAAWAETPGIDDSSRAAALGDGTMMVARRVADLWYVVRMQWPQVESIAHRVLSPGGLWLAAGRPADLPVVVPIAGGWSVVAAPTGGESSSLLLGGLGVAALAAVGGFAAFARAVRRDAKLSTLRTEFVAT